MGALEVCIGYISDIEYFILVSASPSRIPIQILLGKENSYLYLPKSDIGFESDISGTDTNTHRI